LSQPFSRTDLLLMGRSGTPPTMIRHLRFNLPAGSFNAEYRDYDGNVSTSNFATSRSGATLELKPRYPLFGGWKYQFWFAYDVPLSQSVRLRQDGRHVWKGPVMKGLQNVPVDKLEVEVVLPEGA
ncbi:dolichyl-diphosphooligosaccharide--protein glycosyltransferase subunit 1, partial [Gonapodya sp. JEL0774]